VKSVGRNPSYKLQLEDDQCLKTQWNLVYYPILAIARKPVALIHDNWCDQ